MSPPVAKPFPRFIADTAQEKRPYGDWEKRLAESFASACEPLAEQAGSPLEAETIRFYPERTWGGRTFVPAVGYGREDDEAEDEELEYFGYVRYERDGEGEPQGLTAEADFTDVTAAGNPDWQVDLNDAVIGEWRADGGRGGEVTLIWGNPLVRGAIAATAELEGEVLDQAAVNDGRFSLIAVDAVHGFGDELYLEVKLWDRRLRQLASESLYEPEEEAEGAPAGTEAGSETRG